MRKQILTGVAKRLEKIRQQIGCDKKEMAARLGITNSGYYKNEHGESLPSLSSLKHLSDKFHVSMDWLFFDKGPMLYEEKGKKETELEKELKNLQAELEKRNKELTKRQEKAVFIDSRPEMQELLEYIENFPIFYHKLMVFFQEHKLEHHEPLQSK